MTQIKSNELRVGNWVIHNSLMSYRNNGMLLKRPFNFQWELNDYHRIANSKNFYKVISPIPLTLENLVTILGFEGNSSRRYKLIEGTNLTMYFEHGVFSIQDYDWFSQKMPHIQAIHHVQNLVYSLTGKELECNL